MTEAKDAAAVQAWLEAVWCIDGAQIVAALARVTGDIDFAENISQEALVAALAQWPAEGVPRNPAAWLTTIAKRKAIDAWRRDDRLDQRYRIIAASLPEPGDTEWDPVGDDLLRLIFVACHPVLSRQAQVALTLRVVAGLTSEQIARLCLVPVVTMQQRIVRAKRTLSAAQVPFDVPESHEWGDRFAAVLQVVYLMFSEGYAATSGSEWIRPDLASEAHALVALMELQSTRFAARVGPDGEPVLLADQDRSRWDHSHIARGREALARADAIGRGRGNYAL